MKSVQQRKGSEIYLEPDTLRNGGLVLEVRKRSGPIGGQSLRDLVCARVTEYISCTEAKEIGLMRMGTQFLTGWEVFWECNNQPQNKCFQGYRVWTYQWDQELMWQNVGVRVRALLGYRS